MEDRGKGDSTNSRSSLSDRDDGVGSGSSFIRRKTKKAECAARRYYVIFSITMLVVAVIVVVVCVSRSPGTNGLESLIFNKCEYWAFPCASKDQCVNKTLVCDGTPHCRDGSDEDSVCDEYFNRFWEDSYNKRADGDREEASTDCSLDDVPSVCACRDKTKLYCDDRNLTRLPVSFPTKTSVLDLSGNDIDSLEGDQFHSLGDLELLIIKHSHVKTIATGTFRGCFHLKRVELNSNQFERFSSKIFDSPNSITELNLMSNKLTELRKGDLDGLGHLRQLYLSNNMIRSLEEGVFQQLHRLETLDLRENTIMTIKHQFFAHLSSLRTLHLSKNVITTVESGSFAQLSNLSILDLGFNNIKSLDKTMFRGLSNLTTLNLQTNKIDTIHRDTFKPLANTRSLDLHNNVFKRVDNGTFHNLRHINYVYFDKFYMCVYVPQAQVCEPQGDGISSKYHLLENIILRVCVWVVALLACGGNLLVVLGRFLLREDNQIHSFFIKNLSLADLLMGLYLLIIACQDIKFRGEYILHDENWRNSWGCDLAGVLSTLSTEMSVLTLSVITLDRYLSIMYPLSFRRRGLRVAYCVMAFTWALCIMLAILPITGIPYFGTSFYGDNAVCIPLHLHDPRAKGWEFSSFLFVGINLGSFGFIAYAYVAMFYSIHMSALPLRTSRESKERNLVKRFFFIVITDFVCWIPIIVIKIVALAGVEISGALYAWVIVFILPVNSALNPLLYTLTTKLFKKKLLSKFTSVVFRPVQQPESTHSQSSLKNNTSLTRPAQECEMGLLKRYYPSQTRKSSSTHHSSHSDGRHHSNHRHSFSNRQSSQALWRRNNPGKLPQTYIGDPLKSRADGQL